MMEPIRILLVEDSQSDAYLTKRALQKDSKLVNEITHVEFGQEAIDHLAGSAKVPHLVLLDLNLPDMSGHEVLQRIKTDESAAAIPVIVMTSSDSDVDRFQSYREHAAAHITKPIDSSGFSAAVRGIANFYTQIVHIAENPASPVN